MTTMVKMEQKHEYYPPSAIERMGKPPFLVSGRLPLLTKSLRDTVANVLSEFTDEKHTFREVYKFLREYATRKEANYIVRYPDLVWDYCDCYFNRAYIPYEDEFDDDNDPSDEEMRRTVRGLVIEAIRRLRKNEAWQIHYDPSLEGDERFISL